MKVPILKIPFDQKDAAEISQELTDLLLEGRLAMGTKVANFERLFGDFVGSQYALGASSGTGALELIFRALREKFDKNPGAVAVPANTFMASCLAPMAAGFKIILIDCDPDYFQMCPEDLAKKITPETRAVLLVHLGGFISPHWAQIKAIAEKNGAVLIEDAAHAHGAEADGHRAGCLGLAGAFSFYPTKVLTTAEGGMVVTSNHDLYQKLLAIRQHGQQKPGSNVHQTFGLNYRPSEIHALLGLNMMAKVDWILEQRRKAAAHYDNLLLNSPIKLVRPPQNHKPSYYKYMALLPSSVNRQTLKQRLKDDFEISLAGEVYSTPAHLQPFWENHQDFLAQKITALPISEMVAARQICLPIYPGLSFEAQKYVAESLAQVLA
ncbi:MAG: DegT/DnrJ/EryC1/StrS family aminotransferase [Deltaproteobacteria bacterium]|jgi:dTDP-4-amino-4,6-dideoxygalactose transaminase|nr:DegT/DnrJ/EryC1/StrS family aminotransferase [Deltaproteobacteria bacterium]